MSLESLILDSIMNQFVLGEHISNIINSEDMERAILFHPLFSAIVAEMDDQSELTQNIPTNREAKQESKRYKKYVFTDDALNILQNFYDFMHERFPTRNSLEERFPSMRVYISQIFTQPKESVIKFEPKEVQVDISKPLYHTTNAFEVFEMKDLGTPYGPAWFTIDAIYSPEQINDFHPDRGGLRVIRYDWIPFNEIDMTEDYPFIDFQTKVNPKIMDARKLKVIPAQAIEKYFEHNGMILQLPEIQKDKDILMSYGKTWRPFIVKYLESKGFDGILTKNNEIALFHPERWIKFKNVEQGDMLYSSLIESLKRRNREKIPEIAYQFKVDPQSLFILYKRNLENIPK